MDGSEKMVKLLWSREFLDGPLAGIVLHDNELLMPAASALQVVARGERTYQSYTRTKVKDFNQRIVEVS